MKEIDHQFVRHLYDRSSAILRASRAPDIEGLERMAHQLRAAAGGYGFLQITEAASEVERGAAEGLDASAPRSRVEILADLCRRTRAR